MAYNLTNLSAANNIVEYIAAINVLSGNVAVVLFISVLFLVVFAALSVRWGAPTGAMVAGFITFVASLFMYFGTLINENVVFVTFFVMLITIFLRLFTD